MNEDRQYELAYIPYFPKTFIQTYHILTHDSGLLCQNTNKIHAHIHTNNTGDKIAII